MTDFLVELEITGTDSVDPAELDRLRGAEAVRAEELASSGLLLRLWRPADPSSQPRWRNVGLWHAPDEASLRQALESLPLWPWMSASVRTLDAHPHDPGR